MKYLTVVFTHWKLDFFMPFYNWHKEIIKNLRYVWDVSEHKPEEIIKINNSNIMPMKLINLRSNLINQYYPTCLSWFQKEDPEYYVLMESDVVIGTNDFIEKSINFMKKQGIEALFPWLKSATSHPEHPFAINLSSIQPKLWTIPGLIIISKKALNIYAQSLQFAPIYWCEIRFPSELAKHSVIIGSNIYTNDLSIRTGPGSGEERKNWSMSKEEIKSAIDMGMEAFHPIKDSSLLNYIKEVLNEKNSIKKEIS